MSQASNSVAKFLTDNPRWIGVLFAAFMLINSAQGATAALASTSTGP